MVLLLSLPYSAGAVTFLWGDANGDGRFSAVDVVAVLHYTAGWDVAVTNTVDVDGDSAVTVFDVSMLLRALAKPRVTAGGFELDFDWDTNYYLCHPADFSACTIQKYSGFVDLNIQVEQYAGYYPYANTRYVLGEPLQLGHGRAKITLSGTLLDGTSAEYEIFLTDPNPEGYAFSLARVTGKAQLRATAGGEVLAELAGGSRVYYLKTEGSWCLVEQLSTGVVGYLRRSSLKWQWNEVSMPASYRSAISALQAAHPNWHFTFVDVEMTLEQAKARYGAEDRHINPLNYLNESKIYAMLDISRYTRSAWTEVGISAIWRRTSALSKEDAVEYFTSAAESLGISPYYIACRAALESGYGTSKFAKGTVRGYEGYYNFYGINCVDSNPSLGASYAASRHWTTKRCSIVEGANWIKNQYIDQGAVTPYFFRFAGFQKKEYMSDLTAPTQEAKILRRAYSNSDATAYFVVPVYRNDL